MIKLNKTYKKKIHLKCGLFLLIIMVIGLSFYGLNYVSNRNYRNLQQENLRANKRIICNFVSGVEELQKVAFKVISVENSFSEKERLEVVKNIDEIKERSIELNLVFESKFTDNKRENNIYFSEYEKQIRAYTEIMKELVENSIQDKEAYSIIEDFYDTMRQIEKEFDKILVMNENQTTVFEYQVIQLINNSQYLYEQKLKAQRKAYENWGIELP